MYFCKFASIFRALAVFVFMSIGHSALSLRTVGFPGIQDKRNTHFNNRSAAPTDAQMRLRGGGGSEIPKKIKLSYFNIEGIAEKVRLALKIGGIKFEDERVDFAVWRNELKSKTPFAQLPLIFLDDAPAVAQSSAMLRYIGRLCGLYPSDPILGLRIDEICGLQEDLAKALTPSIYIGMRPHLYGFPESLPETERKAIQKRLRESLMAEGGDFPRILGGFEQILKTNGGGFMCGRNVTIADCALLPALRQFKSGRLDGIPVTILEKYPFMAAYYDRMMEIPAVKTHYLCTDLGERRSAESAADYYYNTILNGRV